MGQKVTSGDFSAYLKPLNPPKYQNDADRMFQDFNTMVTELGSIETMKNDFTATGNLAEMVTNILRLNKIEDQTIPLHAANYDVCAQRCDCAAGFSDKMDEKNLELDAETLRHIFAKFYQGDSSHSKEGNGFGLALVRRVPELSRGSITAKSEVGCGLTFIVTLPRDG